MAKKHAKGKAATQSDHTDGAVMEDDSIVNAQDQRRSPSSGVIIRPYPETATSERAISPKWAKLQYRQDAQARAQALTNQQKFDAEKRRLIDAEEDHGFDAMTLWARHNLGVDTTGSEELWYGRSDTFSRDAGRLAKGSKKTGKSGKT